MTRKLKSTLVIFTLSCLLLAAVAWGAAFDFGAYYKSATYQDGVSFGSDGDFTLLRTEIKIPGDYGRLVNITSGSSGTALWFEASDGSIRNVNVDGGIPVIIHRQGYLR